MLACASELLNEKRNRFSFSFNKLQSDTAIKVSLQGNTRVLSTSNRCNRWYFKFNGAECSGPMPIEAFVNNN